MRALFIALRLAGAAAVVAAVIGQLMVSYANWTGEYGIDDPSTQFVNFFSFFTIESNLLTVVVFVIGAVLLIRRSDRDPRWFSIARGSVTAYMATTGIVYNLLLRGVELPQGTTLPWSNEVLHVVAPILMIVDWLLAPGRTRLEWKHIGIVVIFPIVWAIYTMVRGPLVDDAVSGLPYWYPYPFLNPANGGYGSVVLYVLLIAVIIAGVGALVIKVSRMRERWPLPAR